MPMMALATIEADQTAAGLLVPKRSIIAGLTAFCSGDEPPELSMERPAAFAGGTLMCQRRRGGDCLTGFGSP